MNTILLADSGSTKTDWCFIDKNKDEIKYISTGGINPFLQSLEEISAEIKQNLLPSLQPSEVDEIYFYGAGCTFPEKKDVIRTALNSYFASSVAVESDLMAAAHALCGPNPGIACILGTGSNSCQYDGKEIVKHVPPLGYVLGDEGGGVTLGRRLVSDVLKNQLPEKICKRFYEETKLTTSEILENVYKRPFPNRFLASLSPFILNSIDNKEVKELVSDSFESFLRRNVMQYEYKKYPINFVGSIAHYFKPILCETAAKLEMTIGDIQKNPMKGLIRYYMDDSNEKHR